jgi:hypothetical protein
MNGITITRTPDNKWLLHDGLGTSAGPFDSLSKVETFLDWLEMQQKTAAVAGRG